MSRVQQTFVFLSTLCLSVVLSLGGAFAAPKYTKADVERYIAMATKNHVNKDKKVVAARKELKLALARLQRADQLVQYVNKAQTPQQLELGTKKVKGLMQELKMQKTKEYLELGAVQQQQLKNQTIFRGLINKEKKAKSAYAKSMQKMKSAQEKVVGLASLIRQLNLKQKSLSRKYATLSGGQKMGLKQSGNIFFNPNAKKNESKLKAILKQNKLIVQKQTLAKKATKDAKSAYEQAKKDAANNKRIWGWVKKKAKKVASGAKAAARKAKAAALAAKRKAAALARKAKEAAKRAAAAAKKAFQRLAAKAKAWAIRYAKRTVNTFKNKAVSKITTAAASKAWEAYKMTKIKFRGNLMAHLKVGSDYKTIRDKMLSTQRGAKASKVYAKTALISVGLYLTFYAMNTTVGCWSYKDAAKRACLADYIAQSMRDAAFDITSVLVTIALDVFVIEPLSHSFAAVVSAALAAATFGIGVAAYPIAYFAASLAMNAMVLAIQELVLRKYYNKWYNGQPLSQTKRLTTSMVRGMSRKVMVCFGPKSMCKKCYKGTCSN